MKRREFLAVAAVLPLLPAMDLEVTPLVLPPIAGEQPGSVFFDNLSSLMWSSVDGSVRYYDWVGKLLGEWKPDDPNYGDICDLFVQFPLPRDDEGPRKKPTLRRVGGQYGAGEENASC